MKPGKFLALLITGLFVFFSCNKDNNNDSLIRIETETNLFNGEISDFSRYFYDDLGRLTSTTYIPGVDSAYTVDTIVYFNDMIVDSSWINESDTPYVYRSYLNSRGYVDSVEYLFNNDIYSSGSFVYDSEGYMIRENMYSNDYGIEYQYTAQYLIENGNKIRAIYDRVYEFPSQDTTSSSLSRRRNFSPTFPQRFDKVIEEDTYLHKVFRMPRNKMVNEKIFYKDTSLYEYTDTINNISSFNRGISWYGLQNKNLVSVQTIKSNGQYMYTYSYELDEKSRVTKLTANGSVVYLTKYTYSNQTFSK